MARRHRRYRKRKDDTSSGWFLLFLILGAVWYQSRDQDMRQMLAYTLSGLLLIAVLMIGVVIRKRRVEQQKLRALDRAAIAHMDPIAFEGYVAKIMKSRGFTGVRLTERFDYGVDIIAHKDGVRWGVQVKHYKDLVKAAAVRQVYTGLARYKCDRAMVVTTGRFSRPAQVLATDNNCVLIDGDQLAEWIIDFQAM